MPIAESAILTCFFACVCKQQKTIVHYEMLSGKILKKYFGHKLLEVSDRKFKLIVDVFERSTFKMTSIFRAIVI